MRDERWVLDATLAGDDGPPYPFCPLVGDDVMIGLTLVSDRPPGELAGIFHADGPQSAQAWGERNHEHLEYLCRA